MSQVMLNDEEALLVPTLRERKISMIGNSPLMNRRHSVGGEGLLSPVTSSCNIPDDRKLIKDTQPFLKKDQEISEEVEFLRQALHRLGSQDDHTQLENECPKQLTDSNSFLSGSKMANYMTISECSTPTRKISECSTPSRMLSECSTPSRMLSECSTPTRKLSARVGGLMIAHNSRKTSTANIKVNIERSVSNCVE